MHGNMNEKFYTHVIFLLYRYFSITCTYFICPIRRPCEKEKEVYYLTTPSTDNVMDHQIYIKVGCIGITRFMMTIG
jgi:hypothetical protein